MNCRRARHLIHEFLDGALADRAALDAHLAACERCRAELTRLQALERTLRHAVCEPVEEAALERATAGILREVTAGSGLKPLPQRRGRWAGNPLAFPGCFGHDRDGPGRRPINNYGEVSQT